MSLEIRPVAAAKRSKCDRGRARLGQGAGARVGDTVRLGTAPDSLRARDRHRRSISLARIRPRSPSASATSAFTCRISPRCSAHPTGLTGSGFGSNPVSLRTALPQSSTANAFGFRAYSSAAIASESSQTFSVVSRFHRAIALITIVASGVFLLCIMLLKVEERRMDAAVMRFVGVRRRTIFGALVLEAALIAVLGSARRHRVRLSRRRAH